MNIPWRKFSNSLGLLIALLLAGCQEAPAAYLVPLPTASRGRVNGDLASISVYFSQPDSPFADTYRGGPDAIVAQAIHDARFQVDLATYQLDLWSMRDALLRAHASGVSVRVVTEGDHNQEDEMVALQQAGIPMISDQGPGLMHHKFVVIDLEDVWTGSMNFTVHGAYRNDNNIIHIHSQELARNFTVEFEEMFEEGLFGEDVKENTPYRFLKFGGSEIETYFSPDDQPLGRILELVGEAEEQILLLAFVFTSDPLAEAIIERAEKGVVVKGVLDSSQSYTGLGGEWERLNRSGVDIHLDGNSQKMHHKCIMIDQRIVITGSYNFTLNAEEKNDENVLIIHDPEVARKFVEEFYRVYGKGHP